MAGIKEPPSRRELSKNAPQPDRWQTTNDHAETQRRDGRFTELRDCLERLSWKSYIESKEPRDSAPTPARVRRNAS